MNRTKRNAYMNHAVMETLESRQLMSAVGADDVLVGISIGQATTQSPSSQTVVQYDASANTWDGNVNNWDNPNVSGTQLIEYLQGMEFDNTGNIAHNAAGNLLAFNFGNAYTGFEIYNIATDGSGATQSLFSIVAATGGTRGTAPTNGSLSIRGGGLSVSTGNSYVAWIGADDGQIYVMDYNQGSTPGTGAGASITAPRVTGLGDGAGNPGDYLAGGAAGGTLGTAWLNDYTLIAFNKSGQIVMLDMRNHPTGGTYDNTPSGWQPEVMTDWKIINTEVGFNAQTTDIEYNPQVDPNHVYATVTRTNFTSSVYRYDLSWDTSGQPVLTLDATATMPGSGTTALETREMSFDSSGNLWFSTYAGGGNDNVVAKFTGASVASNWTSPTISSVYTSTLYSPYNGLDVASTQTGYFATGDVNYDGFVDQLDYDTVDNNQGGIGGAYWQGDINRDGFIDQLDLDFFA